MFSYVLRRILLAIPTLVGMTAAVFFIMVLSPGGTAADLAAKGEGMKPQEREAIKTYLNKRYGLDKPKIVQYFRWLNQMSPFGFRTADDRELLQEQWARTQIKTKQAGNSPANVTSIARATNLPQENVTEWLDGKDGWAPERWRAALNAVGLSQASPPAYSWPAFKTPDLGMSM